MIAVMCEKRKEKKKEVFMLKKKSIDNYLKLCKSTNDISVGI